MVNRNSGFTLVEILVTMSLLSMIVLVGSYAINVFGQRWDGRLGTFEETFIEVRNMMLVQEVLDCLVPYIAFNEEGQPFTYFEGNRNGFVAVSTQSLLSDDDFAVVRLSVEENEDRTFDVVYEEWPMDTHLLVSIGEPLSFSPPLVLFRSISDPIFEYYGWADVRDRPSDTKLGNLKKWQENYDGVKALFAPEKARLSFESSGGTITILSFLAAPPRGLLSRYQTNQGV